jgi:glutamate 5-kinase
VKVGTGGLTDAAGRFDPDNCRRLATELAHEARARQVVLVSSGAIALGSERLGLKRKNGKAWDMPTKQASAAVGQPYLMAEWQQAFQRHRTAVAQLLLTADDLANRRRLWTRVSRPNPSDSRGERSGGRTGAH